MKPSIVLPSDGTEWKNTFGILGSLPETVAKAVMEALNSLNKQ